MLGEMLGGVEHSFFNLFFFNLFFFNLFFFNLFFFNFFFSEMCLDLPESTTPVLSSENYLRNSIESVLKGMR